MSGAACAAQSSGKASPNSATSSSRARRIAAASTAEFIAYPGRAALSAQASESAQILRAQAMAYWPSTSLAAPDTPPEPATGSMVFWAAS